MNLTPALPLTDQYQICSIITLDNGWLVQVYIPRSDISTHPMNAVLRVDGNTQEEFFAALQKHHKEMIDKQKMEAAASGVRTMVFRDHDRMMEFLGEMTQAPGEQGEEK